MTRRKGQITPSQLREWWPHHVVLSAAKVKGLRNSTVHDFANTYQWRRALTGVAVTTPISWRSALPSRKTRRPSLSASAARGCR